MQVVLVSACVLVIAFAVPSSAQEGEDPTTEHVSVFMELCQAVCMTWPEYIWHRAQVSYLYFLSLPRHISPL